MRLLGLLFSEQHVVLYHSFHTVLRLLYSTSPLRKPHLPPDDTNDVTRAVHGRHRTRMVEVYFGLKEPQYIMLQKILVSDWFWLIHVMNVYFIGQNSNTLQ